MKKLVLIAVLSTFLISSIFVIYTWRVRSAYEEVPFTTTLSPALEYSQGHEMAITPGPQDFFALYLNAREDEDFKHLFEEGLYTDKYLVYFTIEQYMAE